MQGKAATGTLYYAKFEPGNIDRRASQAAPCGRINNAPADRSHLRYRIHNMACDGFDREIPLRIGRASCVGAMRNFVRD